MRKFCYFILASLILTTIATAQKAKPAKHSFDKWEVFAGYTFDRSYGDINQFHATSATKYNDFSPFNLNGGQVTAAYFPWKHVGFKAAFTYSRKLAIINDNSASVDVAAAASAAPNDSNSLDEHETTTSRSYLVGPVVRWSVPHVAHNRVSVFAQQLFGANHYSVNFEQYGETFCNINGESCRASGFATVSGGGLDVRVTRHLSVRPAELDYWNHQVNENHFFGVSSNLYNADVSASGLRYSAGAAIHF